MVQALLCGLGSVRLVCLSPLCFLFVRQDLQDLMDSLSNPIPDRINRIMFLAFEKQRINPQKSCRSCKCSLNQEPVRECESQFFDHYIKCLELSTDTIQCSQNFENSILGQAPIIEKGFVHTPGCHRQRSKCSIIHRDPIKISDGVVPLPPKAD